MDLSAENEKLQSSIASMDALYRKKVNTREDEIEALKESMMQLEESLTEYQRRGLEWAKKKSTFQKELDQLKQVVSKILQNFFYKK